jgi:hypothetical protein
LLLRAGRLAFACAAAVLALAATACTPAGAGDDGGVSEPCPVGFLGDEAGAPDFDMQVIEADGTVTALSDGGSVPLLLPPQGGRVVYVGVHATNLDGCGVQLTGALRDLTTQEVRVDSRTVNLLDTGGGYGVSGTPGAAVSVDIANFSNIAACPNEWSTTNIDGTVYGLEITVVDREGRTLTKKIQVTPACAQPESLPECLCICQGGYILGETCPAQGDE